MSKFDENCKMSSNIIIIKISLKKLTISVLLFKFVNFISIVSESVKII